MGGGRCCCIEKYCGLVAGYPAKLSVNRTGDYELSAYVVLQTHNHTRKMKGAASPGMVLGIEARWCRGRYDQQPSAQFDNFIFTAVLNLFKETPWAEAVREGSPYFPGGTLDLHVVVRWATNVEGEEEDEENEEE